MVAARLPRPEWPDRPMIVVLSPLGGRSQTSPERGADRAGQFEGLRRPPGAGLASQVEALRKQGSRVEVITPDADSRAAMGTNRMDRRPASPPPVDRSPPDRSRS
jgi:NTE family protein